MGPTTHPTLTAQLSVLINYSIYVDKFSLDDTISIYVQQNLIISMLFMDMSLLREYSIDGPESHLNAWKL